MSNLARLEFTALDVSGRNYLAWVVDAELHLASNNLEKTIVETSTASQQDRSKAMILLRHHLHESLKAQYLTVKEPYELWKSLKDRFDHQRTVTLPRARYEWTHLRLQDFKKVSDYNSELFRIVSTMNLCGEKISDKEILEKTLSTFHANNLVLQQQYRERGFKTYSELLSCLILAEENNQLLLDNHHTRPTGSTPLPDKSNNMQEANATFSRRGRGRGYTRGRGRGRNGGRDEPRRNYTWINPDIQKNAGKKNKKQTQRDKPKSQSETSCYRCGGVGHWSRTCRAAPHLVKLYQDSLKGKGKEVEVNLAKASNPEVNHIEANDFLQQVETDGKLTDYGVNFGDLQLDENFF
ncbi:unnamed protein product [Rhodiola kirilowii]